MPIRRAQIGIEETLVETGGDSVPGFLGVCSECDHMVEEPGEGRDCFRRLIQRFRKECPNRSGNTYFIHDENTRED